MNGRGFHRSPEEVVEVYGNMVYKIALSQMKNREDAEDIFQEVFLNYINCKKDFLSKEHEKAYLIKMTANSCKKYFRSAWFRNRAEFSEFADYTAEIGVDEEKRQLYDSVLELPAKYRLVIHLFYYEGMSVFEISHCLHMKESTIKSRLMRGRKLLKTILTGGDEDDG